MLYDIYCTLNCQAVWSQSRQYLYNVIASWLYCMIKSLKSFKTVLLSHKTVDTRLNVCFILSLSIVNLIKYKLYVYCHDDVKSCVIFTQKTPLIQEKCSLLQRVSTFDIFDCICIPKDILWVLMLSHARKPTIFRR